MAQTNIEGAILVVEPCADKASIRVQKFDTFDAFRSEPGDLLRHFTVAGVGSSDLGAAALARTLANHLDAPVGAIVAGYGLSDLLSEALGGWFFSVASTGRSEDSINCKASPSCPRKTVNASTKNQSGRC